MKLNEYINALTRLLNEHGNIDVKTTMVGRVYYAPEPKVGFLKLLQGRESRHEFYMEFMD